MERTIWTDERLNDLAQRVDRDIRELRGDMNAGFADMRGEMNALRSLILRMGGGIMASVVAAAFIHGV
ncbi:MAG TPA: hypothetical protein VHU86_02235 [Solirubrobacterales bacterium]|jgi:hypothetical protein|nr:hypothetical protein [Solirubrobacterales bacterium]